MKTTEYTTNVLKYIPFLYVIWSDDLVSPSEVSIFKKGLDKDTLSQDEKRSLTSWIDANNPSDEIMVTWKKMIDEAEVKLVESDPYPLTYFSMRMALNSQSVKNVDESLKFIEINLGIQPNHYHHLFNVKIEAVSSSSFYSAKEIDILFKGTYAKEVDRFRKKISSDTFHWNIIRDKDIFRTKVLAQVENLAKEGYGAMAYGPEYGGIGNMPAYASVFENLMYVDGSLTIKFGVQFGLFGGSIYNLGTKKHHDSYLTKAGNATLLGCFAMTETRHGSNVRGVKTTATYVKETDSIVIDTPGKDDNKEYIGNALHATMATVFAQLIVDGTNHGVHAILVPVRDKKGALMPGVRIEDNGYKLGLNGVDNGKIWFSNVAVPRENLLNKFGDINENGVYTSPIENPNKRFFTMLGTLVGGRICVAKGALSGAKKALAIAVKYALRRRQFNSSEKLQEDLIMDYPTHQLRLIKPIAKTYVYHFALAKLIEDYSVSNENERREIETQAAALKAGITWFSNQTIQECREACGGKGYLLENKIANIKGDVDIFTTFEGDNTVLIQLAAKGLLTDFKTEFNSDSFMDVLKYVGAQLSDRLTTFNPIFTNKTDKEHLFDPEFHKEALEYRRRRLTFSAASRIQKYIKKGMPSYQAFLKVQTHLVALGGAYAEELCYLGFNNFADTIEDEKNRFLFKKIGALFALSEIQENASWYLERGYISGNKSKAIRKRVERLCTELRPHVNTLVDGYGIPEHCIDTPITE
ncbi:acyl-CoA dehydrogenase family protein [Galbibacter pacificus]|uniref:Acyl-CoA dehydrogenase family protein n=1 Tax=Galbibacter pacificus TaxID=2996052 RepID=A0ABT6FSQ7_9FLAO|nr:acyl-CoA dehydrogenase [Galbibacter pacificus]MDG3582586.1 acyl-CoA dehydrogenase [Galbibacter pacificus]MDG3586295.1 acyl-CoA dehydrogenase family protein [Galbibacter pacificus]